MQNWHTWESATEEDWSLALRREAVIRPLAEQSRLRSAIVTEAAAELDLGRSALYELLQRYRRRPQASSLLPLRRGRRGKESLLEDEREALLKACIDDFYLRPERPSLSALQLEVKRRFAEHALTAPNYRTLVRRVEALDARSSLRRREGAKKAREKYQAVNTSSLKPQRPLELV